MFDQIVKADENNSLRFVGMVGGKILGGSPYGVDPLIILKTIQLPLVLAYLFNAEIVKPLAESVTFSYAV